MLITKLVLPQINGCNCRLCAGVQHDLLLVHDVPMLMYRFIINSRYNNSGHEIQL